MPQRQRRSRGHIRELPSGRFQAIAYAGTDPLTGKLRYVRETATTYQDAEVALTRLQKQVDEDRHPKSDLTVRQAVDQWLEVAKLEDTTRDRYDLIRIYIDPTLGSIRRRSSTPRCWSAGMPGSSAAAPATAGGSPVTSAGR